MIENPDEVITQIIERLYDEHNITLMVWGGMMGYVPVTNKWAVETIKQLLEEYSPPKSKSLDATINGL